MDPLGWERLSVAAATMCLLGLVGCSTGATRLGAIDYTSQYDPNFVRNAASTGQITAVVRGNPFGPGAVDADAIAGAFYLPSWVGTAHVAAHSGTEAPTGYRIVLLFGPHSPGPGDDDTCARPEAQPVENGSGPVRLQATFCIGSRWASTLVAAGSAVNGIDDPAFRALMEQVSYDLLPPKNKKNYSTAMAGCAAFMGC